MLDLSKLPSLPFTGKMLTPDKAAVYAALAGDNVLYVGSTQSLAKRFKAHHRRRDFIRMRCTKVVWCLTEKEQLDQTEKAWIKELSPMLNGKMSDRLTCGLKVGEVIRCYRRIKDVGIREIGAEVGVSHGTLSRIERGEQIDAVTMMKLLRWLFEGDGKNGNRLKGGK